ncbi:MAG: serine/threonine-protein kinase [Actinomycetota bacterium]
MTKGEADGGAAGTGQPADGGARESTSRDSVARATTRVVQQPVLEGRDAPRTVLAGRYRIVRELGHGGMGEVFVAENLSIGCLVAIKVLRKDLAANEPFRHRFQKEAEAIAAVQHANVARFLDLVIGDPTFLVMEYVEGPTLAFVLKHEQALSIERAVELTRRLCWGIDAAHRAGVVHRDIKPSNVILAPDPETGEQPKLIDFGVAKVASKPSDVQLTRSGQMVGTPHYMSPEQITGGDIDARSDVYSLGCLLYHMVAGRPPHIGLDEFQILQGHVNGKFVGAGIVRQGVPVELDQLLQRALAKDPQARFGSMQEMGRALATVIRPSGAPVIEPDTLDVPGLSRTVSRRPSARWPVAVAAGVACIFGALGGWFAHSGSRVSAAGVIVVSSPAGAKVTVDGRAIAEVTPVAVSALRAGEHVVTLHHEGRADVERHIVTRPGEHALVDVTLPPRSRRVSIRTAPPSATVYLDGKMVVGTTPTFMNLVEDDFHELRIERAGSETLTYAMKPEDQRTELEFTLEPENEPRGSISVDSTGVAEVWIDGVFSGFTTPTLDIHVPVGEHTVEVRDSTGARSASRKLDLEQGQSVHLTFSLVAATR